MVKVKRQIDAKKRVVVAKLEAEALEYDGRGGVFGVIVRRFCKYVGLLFYLGAGAIILLHVIFYKATDWLLTSNLLVNTEGAPNWLNRVDLYKETTGSTLIAYLGYAMLLGVFIYMLSLPSKIWGNA